MVKYIKSHMSESLDDAQLEIVPSFTLFASAKVSSMYSDIHHKTREQTSSWCRSLSYVAFVRMLRKTQFQDDGKERTFDRRGMYLRARSI